MVGCSGDEIAITRSGSDALQLLISNYKDIHAGDAVIHCELDYDAIKAAMDWLGNLVAMGESSGPLIEVGNGS